MASGSEPGAFRVRPRYRGVTPPVWRRLWQLATIRTRLAPRMAVPPYLDKSAVRDHEVLPAKPAAIMFESFRLDPRAGQLMRGSDAVALRPKTWSVLVYLAERPGVLVTKDELLDAVWGDVAVTESVLNKSIGELRAALDDSFKAPRLIETVPRRGFRFIAPTLDRLSVTPVPARGP